MVFSSGVPRASSGFWTTQKEIGVDWQLLVLVFRTCIAFMQIRGRTSGPWRAIAMLQKWGRKHRSEVGLGLGVRRRGSLSAEALSHMCTECVGADPQRQDYFTEVKGHQLNWMSHL